MPTLPHSPASRFLLGAMLGQATHCRSCSFLKSLPRFLGALLFSMSLASLGFAQTVTFNSGETAAGTYGVPDETVDSGNWLYFTPGSSAGSSTIYMPLATTSAGLGTATINTQSASIEGASSAESANIRVWQEEGVRSLSRFLGFTDTSTAASSTITNDGWTYFAVNATAGSATIQNNLFLDFYGDATAGHATITNNGYAIEFHQNSTAGFATLNEAEFHESSTAGSATISGNIKFKNTSTAGSATLYSAGSQIIFENSSSAGSATINNGNDVIFEANSTGGTARIINGGGARIRIYDHTGAVTLGSIEGAGSLMLGANTAQVGGNNLSTSFSGLIQDTGGLTKVGTGELILTGANTYTGGTFIEAGTLRINNATGSALGTGAVTIGADGTLTGAGTFSGALQNNGTYAPGNSPTLSTLASFNQGPGGTLVMEIAGLTRGTGYDALDVTGALTFGGTLQVSLIDGFTAASFTPGTTLNLFDWGSASGTFSTLNLPDISAYNLAWDTSALYTAGELSVTTSAVPEPATYVTSAGLLALGFVALRRRRPVSRSLGEG